MANITGYTLKSGEWVCLEFVSAEKCPVVGTCVIRPMRKLEIRNSEGNLAGDLLKK